MTKLLEYITLNYTWFLGGAILILLAVIGYYADKTNFGQGKPKKDDDNNKNKDNGKALEENKIEPVEFEDSEVEEENIEESKIDDSQNLVDPLQMEENTIDSTTGDTKNMDIVVNEDPIVKQTKPKIMKSIDKKQLNEIRKSLMKQKNEINVELNKDISKSDNFSAFDDEFNSLIPKKDILENDLLSDIQDIKLDKTKKKKKEIKDVPDLDNVELPKIRKMESSKKDVWKK